MRFVFLFLTAISLAACSSSTSEVELDSELMAAETTLNKAEYKLDTLRGVYSGNFGNSEIRIVINYINDSKVVGYNVHKGLQRNLLGTVREKENDIELMLEEPGDNPYDGIFTVSIDKKSFKMSGSWESLSGKISKKTFKLSKEQTNNINDMDWDNIVVTKSNFADIFYYVTNEKGNFSFKENGMVIYAYYPATTEYSKQQMIEIKGSWSFADDEITINWQANDLFPTRVSTLTIEREENYIQGLKMDDESYYIMMW
jgi:hypothetical protein